MAFGPPSRNWQVSGSLIGAMALLVLIYVFYNSVQGYRSSQDLSQRQLEQKSLQVSGELSVYFRSKEELFLAIAQSTCVKEKDTDACSAFFQRLIGAFPNVVNFAGADKHGRFFASGMHYDRANPPSVVHLDLYKELVGGRPWFVMNPHVGPISGVEVTGMVIPLLDANGNYDGHIGVSIRVSEINELWERMFASEGQKSILVIDRNHTIIASTEDLKAFKKRNIEEVGDLRRIYETHPPDTVRLTKTPLAYHTSVEPISEWTVVALSPSVPNFWTYIMGQPHVVMLNISLLFLTVVVVVSVRRDYLAVSALRSGEKQLRQARDHLEDEVAERTAELRESENRLSTVLDSSSIPLTITRLDDGLFLYGNSAAERLFEIASGEFLGRFSREFYANPDDRKYLIEALARDGEIKDYEILVKSTTGKPFWVSVSGRVSQFQGEEVLIAGFSDLTERKQIEEQLRQSQKLEAIGQLTGGVAHDFNNMLGVIMGNLELLRRRVTGDAKASEFVEEAYKGSKRGVDITQKLLAFSKQTASEPQRIEINNFIEDMVSFISKSLTPKIQVETQLAADIWPVSIDPNDLEDSLLNLSLNAGDAMPDGGTLVIETVNKVLDEDYVQANPDASLGDYVMVSVSDTGVGMRPEVLEQAFEPFFSTKEKSKGTGLGLSMVYGFVQRSGGHIKLYSEENEGTTVRIYLPRNTDPEPEVDTSREEVVSNLPIGTETILVVDDEDGLLIVATSYLDELGYTTLSASHAKEALHVLDGPQHIDLVFSDVVMPGDMDGYGLAKEVLKRNPDIKVLLTSGFTAKREEFVNGDRPFYEKLSRNLLSKPYTQAELGMAVRRTLDDRG